MKASHVTAGALLLTLWSAPVLAAHGPYGPAGWIYNRFETRWCCGEDDCYPVPNRVHYDLSRGWTVDGLEGGLQIYDAGFYWDPPDDVPWACQAGTTKGLRCLILPRPKI